MSDLTITADQITESLRDQLAGWEPELDKETVGYVTSVADGVARVEGLPSVMASELLEFPGGLIGVALNIDEDDLGVVFLGEASHIEEGDPVKQTGTVLSVPVGDALLGPGHRPARATRSTARDRSTPPSVVSSRPRPRRWSSASRSNQPLQTGIKAIDSMTPIGRGQRQLIIGDRQTGKTAILVDTIINQKVNQGHQGRGQVHLRRHRSEGVDGGRGRRHARGSTAPSSTRWWSTPRPRPPPPSRCMPPTPARPSGQHWMYNGEHALVMFDDLSKQAVAYREISLLLRRPPGREAYPGDVFYLHSRLLERCAKLSDELGAGR